MIYLSWNIQNFKQLYLCYEFFISKREKDVTHITVKTTSFILLYLLIWFDYNDDNYWNENQNGRRQPQTITSLWSNWLSHSSDPSSLNFILISLVCRCYSPEWTFKSTQPVSRIILYSIKDILFFVAIVQTIYGTQR